MIETFKGAGFLSAVSIMGEIGDFSAFSKPKQLFAYFGLDPAVKQSGKFEGTKVQMSKRGSAIARRVIHTLTLQSISISRNGEAKNPELRFLPLYFGKIYCHQLYFLQAHHPNRY